MRFEALSTRHKVSADAAGGKDLENIADIKEIEDEASVFNYFQLELHTTPHWRPQDVQFMVRLQRFKDNEHID